MYCQNAITVDTQGFLTVDKFDQLVKNRAQEEHCDYIEAALLTASLNICPGMVLGT